eukprot:CAMPEP_0202725612 /NCGR_PEP_ID=MMETSP1385-20130828/183630_1 /ASSEMBLY_ACC=CAM_ASM_000861 /TAXON_ID=933848 /ORGANISM="Elphidium margaritaceum" /LENGTH=214 /DNA_ID=CAMNT_0049391777 /DNA_START=380 /DNA_END=1024 /DNA_ORIENTATION=+
MLIVTFIRLTSKLQDLVFAIYASVILALLAGVSCVVVCSVFIARLRHIYNLHLSRNQEAGDEENEKNKKMLDLMIKYALLTGVSSFTTLAGIVTIIYAVAVGYSEQVGGVVDTFAIFDVWTDLVCTALAFERVNKVYLVLFGCLHKKVYRKITASREDSEFTFAETVATAGTGTGSSVRTAAGGDHTEVESQMTEQPSADISAMPPDETTISIN